MRTRRFVIRIALGVVVLSLVGGADRVQAQPGDDLDISHEKYVLDNGLTLIVHEDRKGGHRPRDREAKGRAVFRCHP